MTIETTEEIVAQIRGYHRRRRYAMKVQQKLDRAMESYVRINFTEWQPDADEAERKKMNAEVRRMIKAAADGEGEADLVEMVAKTNLARSPMDDVRTTAEAEMTNLAKRLPVYSWLELPEQHGAAAIGLATIVAEAGPLHNYPKHGKLFKRLGLAPYDGHAGSTWKREKWRPRALTKDEWIANPFSGERYAMLAMIADPLFKHNWIGAAKSETGEGQPKPGSPYGAAYAERRAHTAKTHPDWSKMHSHRDAMRVMLKLYVRNLWEAWIAAEGLQKSELREPINPLSSERRVAPGADAAKGQMSPTGTMPRQRKSRKAKKSLSSTEAVPSAKADAATQGLSSTLPVPRRPKIPRKRKLEAAE